MSAENHAPAALPQVKSTGYRCDSRLGGPKSAVQKRKIICPLPRIELRFLGGPASSVVTVPTEFLRLINRKEKGWESVDWIYLAKDRDQRQVPVNRAIKLRVP